MGKRFLFLCSLTFIILSSKYLDLFPLKFVWLVCELSSDLVFEGEKLGNTLFLT